MLAASKMPSRDGGRRRISRLMPPQYNARCADQRAKAHRFTTTHISLERQARYASGDFMVYLKNWSNTRENRTRLSEAFRWRVASPVGEASSISVCSANLGWMR